MFLLCSFGWLMRPLELKARCQNETKRPAMMVSIGSMQTGVFRSGDVWWWCQCASFPAVSSPPALTATWCGETGTWNNSPSQSGRQRSSISPEVSQTPSK